ncbi:hypothetical protein BB427_04630 [Pseudoalteromonas sp. BMB]|uniref:tetratricopeptide repeat protein n=1 Tax=Pseudoalteromonas sp. BMB TaxID=1874619 RepID=UPI00083CD55F|nr:hypothetical protein [Pseudoalteromonas sp. BMB]ODB34388.1 hypothetical protein BB427_04630 [Pseudoalteromonas sp. BMB]
MIRQPSRLILTLVVLMSGCSTQRSGHNNQNAWQEPSYSNFSKSELEANRIAKSECPESYMLGNRYYQKYSDLRGLDVSNFLLAISFFERAKSTCDGHEYQDDVIYSLANAYFYTGSFADALDNYKLITKVFTTSSLNYGKNGALDEVQLFEECIKDPYFEEYRKGQVFELHEEYSNARKRYIEVMKSVCFPIRNRAEKKDRFLKYKE